MSDYPVQLEKVQAPPLREETLARDRLLDWLNVQIHRRVVLVLAEAGYGKTTLLADFSRRTRIRVAWYRLDRGDRDWLGFLAHLVAALRIHEPDFGPATHSLIREASAGTTPREAVLDTFLRELAALPPEPLAFVFDDVHLVEESPDARVILRELLARAPERMSFVLVSRAAPPLSLARLRARGEVAELKTADLRFAPDETERLFRDTFAIPLEPAVLAELASRTEGWIASLQLVRAAIRDRNQVEIRAFVRSLSGAEGDLYDYLAEEVVGELPIEMQQFLMRTALLEVVEPVLAGVAAGSTIRQTRAAIDEGEVLGLFSRIGPGRRDQVRAHPLVRDFLEARLHRSIGMDAVREIHRAIAAAAEPLDWRIAGHHYLAAGSLTDARRVLAASIEIILATGAYAAAEELATALDAPDGATSEVLIVRSRLALQKGDTSSSRDLAERAFQADSSSAAAAVTLSSARLLAGDIEGATAVADRLANHEFSGQLHGLGRSISLTLRTSVDGPLEDAKAALAMVITGCRASGGVHYLGVGLSNLGYLHKAQGDARRAFVAAEEAISCLESTSAGTELISARLLAAWAHAHLGNMAQSRAQIDLAVANAEGDQQLEVAYEAGEIEAFYGDPRKAMEHVAVAHEAIEAGTDAGEQALVARIHAQITLGLLREARLGSDGLRWGRMSSSVAFEARRRLALGMLESLEARDGSRVVFAALDLARRQGAFLWARVARLVTLADTGEFELAAREEGARDRSTLSMAADVLARRLDQVDEETGKLVLEEAIGRPERWREPLRCAVSDLRGPSQAAAASLLGVVGTFEDVALLRRHSRSAKGGAFPHSASRTLARRLAPKAAIEDLGRVQVTIGSRTVDGATIRRKVLALLCLLLTKHRFAATREEVLDALWPDLDPSTAMNSLNQTVYFLRRVFEPAFSEDTTPGYLGQDGETLWLDPELVDSRSARCRELIRAMAVPPEPESVLRLVTEYRGRFALDFLYEEWSASHRDSLHAAFLRLVESGVRADLDAGEYGRGIKLAQLALDVEPDAEELQVGILRLYRLSGAMAAAAEQYQHYARSQREMGMEPERLEHL